MLSILFLMYFHVGISFKCLISSRRWFTGRTLRAGRFEETLGSVTCPICSQKQFSILTVHITSGYKMVGFPVLIRKRTLPQEMHFCFCSFGCVLTSFSFCLYLILSSSSNLQGLSYVTLQRYQLSTYQVRYYFVILQPFLIQCLVALMN